MTLGQQEDASQFNLTLLRHLESSFAAWKMSDANHAEAAEAFKQLFTGQCRQFLKVEGTGSCSEKALPDLEGAAAARCVARHSCFMLRCRSHHHIFG